MPLTRGAFEFGAIVTALALLATLVVFGAQARDWLLPNGQPVFGDFLAFWGGGRAALDGNVAPIHDPQVLRGYQREAIPSFALLMGWNSPPQFLLIAAPLALLPYPLAALVFLTAGAALYVLAARALLPDTRALVFALTLPAALYHLGTVQTGLLIAGISGLALAWIDTRPRAAGALIGLLTIKPHLALLWPIYLALTGRWRAFVAAAVSTMALALLAGLVFGFDAYVRFAENLPATQALITGQRLTTPAAVSLYASVIALGATPVVAIAAHALSAAPALALALWLFRVGDARVQGAAFCAATLIVLPYVYFYDFTLLAIGAAMLGAPRGRFETAALALAWSAGLALPLAYLAPIPLAPIAAWAVLISAARRTGSVAPRPAPAQHT